MSQSIPEELLNNLALRFANHSENVYGAANANSSPLYAYLAGKVAADADILVLVAKADLATQVTNLLFGSVHYLLLGGVQHPLAEFFPDLSAAPRPVEEAYPDFRAFCLEQAEAIEQLVTTRRVQTNEVGRCAGLLPIFGLVEQRENGKPLAMVEIGVSAGLLMRWDDYAYDYGKAGKIGHPEAPLQIVPAIRGGQLPPLPAAMPSVTYRVGLELHPIDPGDESATRWLRALIWPEHQDRSRLLKAALDHLQQNPVRIIPGNAAETLPAALAEVPDDATVCVYHSYALNQMPGAVRERILDHLMDYAQKHDFYRISQEWFGDQDQPHLHLHSYQGGDMRTELMAYSESHGRWIEWVAS